MMKLYSSLELISNWVIFTEPLVQVISLEDENVGRLRGCLFAISEDGTIATLSLDGPEL